MFVSYDSKCMHDSGVGDLKIWCIVVSFCKDLLDLFFLHN